VFKKTKTQKNGFYLVSKKITLWVLLQ